MRLAGFRMVIPTPETALDTKWFVEVETETTSPINGAVVVQKGDCTLAQAKALGLDLSSLEAAFPISMGLHLEAVQAAAAAELEEAATTIAALRAENQELRAGVLKGDEVADLA